MLVGCGGVATAVSSLLNPVSTIQKIGKNITAAMPQPSTPISTFCHADCFTAQVSKLRATERTRKNATMLARTIAITPPADPPPTSNCCNARA